MIEAVLLAAVAILAAYSGYAAAKWGTERSLLLAQASTARTEANRADLDALEARNFDATAFNAWFEAFLDENPDAMELAERRFSDQLGPAFDAWIATDPTTNPDAPRGPTYMDEYVQPDLERAVQLETLGDDLYREGAEAGRHADDYVRTTVFLATVLFLVGISSQFRVRRARYGLIGVAAALFLVSVTLLVITPYPPS